MAQRRAKPQAWIPARPPKRGAKPALLGDVLVSTQEYVSRRSGGAMTHDEWRAIVGPRIAGRTRVGKNYRGLLTIKVASSAWCNELSFLKDELIGKLTRAGHDVRDLRFRVDPGEQRPRSRRPSRRPAPEKATVSRLSPELEAKLAQVEDPNLRAAIAEAARSYLKNK